MNHICDIFVLYSLRGKKIQIFVSNFIDQIKTPS